MQPHHMPFDIHAIQNSWTQFDSLLHLRPIHDEASYAQMTALLDMLLDVTGDDEDHALTGLLELVGDLVARYEHAHYPIEAVAPHEALRFLMDARELKQSDLSALVAQSNLSAILAGKRKISTTLAGKLGAFFRVNPGIFVLV